jgi:hypothetical protein
LSRAAPTIPGTFPPGPGSHGPHSGLDSGFFFESPEQSDLRLVEDDDLGVRRGDPELVERVLGRLLDGLARHLYPFHF